MFRHVLVGVDPTHEDEAAGSIREALRQLEEGGELALLAGVNRPGGPGFFPVVADDHELEEIRKHASRELEVLIRKHVPRGIRTHSLVRTGGPGEVLIKASVEMGAGLIVLVEHGHRWPLSRDTVQYVVSHADCPVLVVPPLAGEQP